MARKGVESKTVYLITEDQKEAWKTLKGQNDGKKDSQIILDLIVRETDEASAMVVLDAQTIADLDYIVERKSERSGRKATRVFAISEIAKEKATEYDQKLNNSARITTVVETLKEVTEAVDQHTKTDKELSEQVNALIALVSELALIIKESKP